MKSTETFEKKIRILDESLHNLANTTGLPFSSHLATEVLRAYAEIDRLEQLTNREWIPIESVERLADEPDGTFELISKKGEGVCVWKKQNAHAWRHHNQFFIDNYSHYRLITAAADFIPPEPPNPKTIIKIGLLSWTLDKLADETRADILAAAEAIKAGGTK